MRSSSGLKADDITRGRINYDLRRLRLHRLIERIPHSHWYHLTSVGLKVALFYSRTCQNVIRPGLSLLHSPQNLHRSGLARAYQAVIRASVRFWGQLPDSLS